MATTAYQTYTIPSATTPGKAYRVTVHADGDTSCDCPDATYRRRQCKHQRQVLVLWTEAGRSGALVEAAQTNAAGAVACELRAAEQNLAALSAIRDARERQSRHDWLTADTCTCGYRCDRASSLEYHITTRNQAPAVPS